MSTKRIYLIHDGLVVSGGAERVTAALCQILPQAELFTSAWLPEKTFSYFKDNPPKIMAASKLVRNEQVFKALYPLWWLGFRNLNLTKSDLVFSSSSYLAKFVRPPAGIPHICYLHNPFRYLWNRDSYEKDSLPLSGFSLKIADAIIPLLRRLDRQSTRQITHIITNSQYTANRIKSIYGRESEVVYPPISVSKHSLSNERSDEYLFVGRLLSYKKADLAIKACQSLGKKLLIVGNGPEEANLRRLAGSNIKFLGRVSDQNLKKLYSRARGLIFPGHEDFGLIPVEAQAAGCPVIAFGAGGVLETVIADQTGIFFKEQNKETLESAIVQFEKMRFNQALIHQNAKRFDLRIFNEKIKSILNRYL